MGHVVKIRIRRRTFVCVVCGAEFRWRSPKKLHHWITLDAVPHRHMSRTYMDTVMRLARQTTPVKIRSRTP